VQKTLIIFKPDTLMRGVVGELITRFERVGLKIVAAKMVSPDYEHYHGHYEGIGTLRTRKGEKIFEAQVANMLEGPVIAMVLEGVEAVETVRKMVGDTEPKSAQPGTIRGDYAHMSYARSNEAGVGIPNLIHASADADEAKQEIAHWFSETEIHDDYETVHEVFTQAKRKK
jgi:nucleoside-diphosphate kinase